MTLEKIVKKLRAKVLLIFRFKIQRSMQRTLQIRLR